MCRLFGFKSSLKSQIHKSLIDAENALINQSNKHKDGWGVAFYSDQDVHVIRSNKAAINCNVFKETTEAVSSRTVVAHLRLATQGNNDLVNTHPFRYGKWVFAHNGNIKDFESKAPMLRGLVDPELRKHILGTTDSEIFFYIILTELKKRGRLESTDVSVPELMKVCGEVIPMIEDKIGSLSSNDKGPPTDNYLSFIICNGVAMVAHNGGKTMYYSPYKNRCSERDTCKHFQPRCEARVSDNRVNHLLISSEPLEGENYWLEIPFKELVGIDETMQLIESWCFS